VKHLTGRSFKRMRRQSEMLVMFYAPWCGHCKKLKPSFTTAAEEAKDVLSLAAIDCTDHRPLCAEFEVTSYPTLKHFPIDQSAPSDCRARSYPHLISYIDEVTNGRLTAASEASGDDAAASGAAPMAARESESSPGSWTDGDTDEVVRLVGDAATAFGAENERALLFFHAPWCKDCGKIKPGYAAAAAELAGKFVLAALDCDEESNKAYCTTRKVRGLPTLKFLKDGDWLDYTGLQTSEALIAFGTKYSTVTKE